MSFEFMALTEREHQIKAIVASLRENTSSLDILILHLKNQGLSFIETAQALRDLRFISLTDCKQLVSSYFPG